MTPATLDKSDLRVHDKIRNCLEEEVLFGDEVGIEDGEEFSLCDFHAFLECTGLEILTVRAVNELDIVAAGGEFCNFSFGDFVTFVRGVVQNLNFVFVLGIVDSADCF